MQISENEVVNTINYLAGESAKGQYVGAVAEVIKANKKAGFDAGRTTRHIESISNEVLLKNQRNGAEIIRVTPLGQVFVNGKEEKDPATIGKALQEWAKSASENEGEAEQQKPTKSPAKGSKGRPKMAVAKDE